MSRATGPLTADRSRRIRLGRGIEIGISLYGAAVFMVLWIGLAVGLATDGRLLADGWAWLTGLEPVAAVATWILILPIGVGLWAWNEVGSEVLVGLVAVGLVGWTLVAVNGLVKVFRRH